MNSTFILESYVKIILNIKQRFFKINFIKKMYKTESNQPCSINVQKIVLFHNT
jgi:hypothetical protein